jgi:dTDP-4-amino-4,6-dideoxygalactose transaminase
MHVPLVDIAGQEALVADEVLVAIAQVAKEGRFILGSPVEQFEHWLAAATGAAHAVGVASGSDALQLSLRALGVASGDAVVTSAFSFVAAAEAIANVGARPVFCDVDAQTMNVSEHTVQDALDGARRARLRVRAVIPVHLFGLCARLEPLRALALREEIALVEDAAQAIGAIDADGNAAGRVGDAAAFSFFPTKNLGAWGDGGAVVTSREDVASRVRRLRAHGSAVPHVHTELGQNSRLDTLQAAILLIKTRLFATWQAARSRIASRYVAEFARFPLMLPSVPDPPALHGWHAFIVRSDRRDALARWLRERGVDVRVYYPTPLHRQPCFASLGEPSRPAAEDASRTSLALPLYPTMRDAQQDYVIEQVARFFEERF